MAMQSVFVYRGRWWPLVIVPAALYLTWHGFLNQLAYEYSLPCPDEPRLVAAGLGLMLAAWLALTRSQSFTVTSAGVEYRSLLRGRRLVPWEDVVALQKDERGSLLMFEGGCFRIGPEVRHRHELLAKVEGQLRSRGCRAAPAAPLDELCLDDCLRGAELRFWAFRPLRETFWPLFWGGVGAGVFLAALGYCAAPLVGGVGRGFPYGMAQGAKYGLLSAILISLPARVTVRQNGFRFRGMTRWCRRSWNEVLFIDEQRCFVWLVTVRETFVFRRGNPATHRLAHAARQVLQARQQGRIVAPAAAADVPSRALSRAEVPQDGAARGLSRSEGAAGHQ